MLYLYCPWYPISRYYPTVRVYKYCLLGISMDFISVHDINTPRLGHPMAESTMLPRPFSDSGSVTWSTRSFPRNDRDEMGTLGRRIMVHLCASVYGAPSCIPDKSEIIIIQTEKYYHIIIISYPNKLTESEKEAAKHSQANLHPLKAKGQARAHCLATQRRDLIANDSDDQWVATCCNISWPPATQRPLKRPLLRTKSVEKWPGSWENRGDQGDEAKTWCVLWMRVRGFKVLIDVNRCK